jgi:hypothetical protein
MESQFWKDALLAAMNEAFDALEGEAWYEGLLPTLEHLDAVTASRTNAVVRSSIAAHCEHLRYVLEVMNAWAQGERPEMDWAQSWQHLTVSPEAWNDLQSAIRDERNKLEAALRGRTEWTQRFAQLAINNVAHIAYHVGAIRQLLLHVR